MVVRLSPSHFGERVTACRSTTKVYSSPFEVSAFQLGVAWWPALPDSTLQQYLGTLLYTSVRSVRGRIGMKAVWVWASEAFIAKAVTTNPGDTYHSTYLLSGR